MSGKGIRGILEQFPFSSKYQDRQEEVLALYFYEKLGGTRKDGYEEAEISESAAVNIDEAYSELTPGERRRLMRYLDPIYDDLTRGEEK